MQKQSVEAAEELEKLATDAATQLAKPLRHITKVEKKANQATGELAAMQDESF